MHRRACNFLRKTVVIAHLSHHVLDPPQILPLIVRELVVKFGGQGLTTSSIRRRSFPSLLGHMSTHMSSFCEKSSKPRTFIDIFSESSGLISLAKV
jgi:hypothetical protein